MTNNNDSRFFTNTENNSLLERFKQTLKHVGKFDVLVGYFRSSGFFSLYKDLENIDEIRILNGLDIDEKTFDIIEESKNEIIESGQKTKENFAKSFETEVANSNDTKEVYEGLMKFKEFIKSGKIRFKQHPSHNIHAKVYISRFKGELSEMDYGRVITGSSNFSKSGFVDNYEFNVELKEKTDVVFALEQFEKLWEEGEDISNVFLDSLENKTWLNNNITPYQIFLKTLYEYFYEDINLDQETDFNTPDDFMDLEYQKQAVVAAGKILDAYNGVFLSDVVGVGKTYIAALLAQQPKFKSEWKLVICPPVLKDYWEETFQDFGITKFHVRSAGNLKDIKSSKRIDDYRYVFIDEAHRFRNEETETYEELYNICFGKKIILLSATPLNNYFTDILSLLKLFQRPNRSNIPGVRNLTNFFKPLQKKLDDAKNEIKDEYIKVARECSSLIRENIFKHVMVRRTRKEIKEYFSEDINKQGLSFPEVAPPIAIGYEFGDSIDNIFHETIDLIKNDFKKARYMPYLYLKIKKSEFENARQINIGGFMKTMLVKRLESSFHAFRLTIKRFIKSHEDFIGMYNSGSVLISKKINVYELMDEDDEEKITKLIEKGDVEKFKSTDFNENFKEDLDNDLQSLKMIEDLWKDVKLDPKLEKFKKELKNDQQLKNQKIIVFTESKETGEYLLQNLSNIYGEKVFFYSSSGGSFFSKNDLKKLSIKDSRDYIKKNFDPNQKAENQLDDLNILISTDILAEGINLHRSNIEINYDLPWNPTRVIQRTGRVNRVGSSYEKVHIYNFFPTKESDSEIGQKKNIITKIQAIHECLGSDSKFLSETEEVDTFQLFGDTLYEKLNEKDFYDDESSGEVSELKYLKVIRELRDENKDLFSKIKEIVKKARTAKISNNKFKESLLTFFRKGKLKKFIVSKNSQSKEITFLDAANAMECNENEEKKRLPPDFFDKLKENQKLFDEILKKSENEEVARAGRSNERQLLELLKSMRNEPTFNDEDYVLLRQLIRAFEDGIIPRKTSKKILNDIKKEEKPPAVRILSIFRGYISEKYLEESIDYELTLGAKREVVLSEYFY